MHSRTRPCVISNSLQCSCFRQCPDDRACAGLHRAARNIPPGALLKMCNKDLEWMKSKIKYSGTPSMIKSSLLKLSKNVVGWLSGNKKRARRRVFQPWELTSLIEWEGRRRQLIVQLFFTDVRSFEHAHLSFALGCAQNLKTVMADCQPGTRNLNAGRQQLLRDRMSGGNGGNHGSHSSIR